MKKTLFFKIYLAFILNLLLLQSCTKNESIIQYDNNDRSGLTHETQMALKAPNLTSLKQSVSLLSPEERQKLWILRWNTMLKNDASKLTTDQKNIIISMRDFLTKNPVSELLKNPTSGELFIKSQLPFFEKHFNNAQLYMLIECPYFTKSISVFNSLEYLNAIDRPYPSTNTNATEGSFITDISAMPRCQCFYSIYCSFKNRGVCLSGGCTKVSGCGLASTSNCTGLCA
jgi:hypothetical protein